MDKLRKERVEDTEDKDKAGALYVTILFAITSNTSNTSWIIDSNTSYHISNNKWEFLHLKCLQKLMIITDRNDNQIITELKGLVCIKTTDRVEFLIEALYMPEANYSLLSKSWLTDTYSIYKHKDLYTLINQLGV